MIKSAVVGVGFIGEEHIEAIRRTNLGWVEAIVGRDLEKTKAKAEVFQIPHYYNDIQPVLENPEIQVVHICTPNALHYPMVKKALEAGKHVVCEKPLTMTEDEARELTELAEQKNLVNAIHFNIRYYPLVRQAKVMIEKGEIGRIYSVTGSYLQDWLVKDRKCCHYLREKNIEIVGNHVGELLTVQEQAGFQMCMVRMDDELLSYWNAPCRTPYFKM